MATEHKGGCICADCENVRKDAARYRWLRDSAGNGVMKKLMKECRPDGWDALVDRDRHGTRRGVPSEHEFDEHGKCKWCPAESSSANPGAEHG